MKIAVNATFMSRQLAGVGVYTQEVARRLQGNEIECNIIAPFPEHFPTNSKIYRSPTRFCGSLNKIGNIGRAFHINSALPVLLKRLHADLLYNPIVEYPFVGSIPKVVTVHDLHPIYFPDQFGAASLYFRLALKLLPNKIHRVLVPSEFVKREVLRFTAMDPTRITVTPLGYDRASFQPQPAARKTRFLGRHNITPPYLLFVGTLFPYKNLTTLLEAFRRLKSIIPHQLVVVGRSDVATSLPRSSDRVLYFDYVDHQALPSLYSYSDAYVQPSLAEGFGLTVVEAMACGTPVIASRAGSLPEVVGDAGQLFDPHDTGLLADLIYEVVTDRILAEDLSVRGLEQAGKFSWQHTGDQTMRVCRKLVGPWVKSLLPIEGGSLKILQLLYESRHDSFGFGGAAIRAYEIYRYLKERHDITLLCRMYPGARDGRINGLKHMFVGGKTPHFTAALLCYAREARRFVLNHGANFDLIAEEFSPAVPMFLSRYRKRPLILQIQGYTGTNYFSKYPLYYALPLYLLEKYRPFFYRNIVHVSPHAAGLFSAGRHSRVEVISNGIDKSLLSLEPIEENYILYLGRLDIHHKGLDVLFDAYRMFAQHRPDLQLRLVGSGGDLDRCSQYRRALPTRLQDNIKFLGWMDGREKWEQLRRALFVVVPSRYETQGIVVLEAAACGKPIVASSISAFQPVFEARAAEPFRAGCADDLADKMLRLSGNLDHRIQMATKARRWVKELTWDKVAAKFESVLEQVANENPSAHL